MVALLDKGIYAVCRMVRQVYLGHGPRNEERSLYLFSLAYGICGGKCEGIVGVEYYLVAHCSRFVVVVAANDNLLLIFEYAPLPLYGALRWCYVETNGHGTLVERRLANLNCRHLGLEVYLLDNNIGLAGGVHRIGIELDMVSIDVVDGYGLLAVANNLLELRLALTLDVCRAPIPRCGKLRGVYRAAYGHCLCVECRLAYGYRRLVGHGTEATLCNMAHAPNILGIGAYEILYAILYGACNLVGGSSLPLLEVESLALTLNLPIPRRSIGRGYDHCAQCHGLGIELGVLN